MNSQSFFSNNQKPKTMRTNPEAVREVASRRFGVGGTGVVWQRRFVATFGCDNDNVAELWNNIDSHLAQLNHRHLVWILAALCFLRTYPTCESLATKLNKDEKTIRKHAWTFTEYLSRLEMVCLKLEFMCNKPDDRYLPLTADTKRKLNQRAVKIRERMAFLHRERDTARDALTSWNDVTSSDGGDNDDPSIATQPTAEDSMGEQTS